MANVYESTGITGRDDIAVQFRSIRVYDASYLFEMVNGKTGETEVRQVVKAQLGPNLRGYLLKLKAGDNPVFSQYVYGTMYLSSRNIPVTIEMPMESVAYAMSDSSEFVNSTTRYGYNMVYDVYPKSGTGLLEGTVTETKDGDTFSMIVTNDPQSVIGDVQEGMSQRKLEPIKKGDLVTIRLGGINTPEVHKPYGTTWEEDAIKRNTAWIQQHGYANKEADKEIEMAFSIGEEAKSLTKNLLNNATVVVNVDLAYDTSLDQVMQLLRGTDNMIAGRGIDAYGRILGEVFVVQNHLGGYDSVNLNKTLIANPSKTESSIALAEISYYIDAATKKPQTTLPVLDWYALTPEAEEIRATIAREKANTIDPIDEWLRENHMHIDAQGEILYNDAAVTSDKEYTYTAVAGDSLQSISTRLGFTVSDLRTWSNLAYGDMAELPAGTVVKYRMKYQLLAGQDNRNLVPAETENEEEGQYQGRVDDRRTLDTKFGFTEGRGFTRIGDCCFVVPPTSIYIESSANGESFQKIRSNGPTQTRGHQQDTLIRIKLFFATIEQVNGTKMNGLNRPYYRNGLLPMIAQFQKAPFLPIDNELINNTHHIYDVALLDLQINTVPGFPECLEAELTMAPFNHTVHMPKVGYLAGAFCWPLYRWYYQQAIEVPVQKPEGLVYEGSVFNGRKKKGLRPVSSLTDEVKFFIADENELAERKQAIMDLQYKMDPELFVQANTDEYASATQQSYRDLQIGLAQYNRFTQVMTKYPRARYPYLYNGGTTPYPVLMDVLDTDKQSLAVMADILGKTYQEGEKPIFLINGLLTNIVFNPQIFTGLAAYSVVAENLDMTSQMEVFNRINDMFSIEGAQVYPYVHLTVDDRYGGFLVAEVTSPEILSRIPSQMKIFGNYCAISPKDQAKIDLFKNSDAREIGLKKYELEFETLNTMAHMTEADVPMVEFPLDGLITEKINFRTRNTMVPIKILKRQDPSFQYLGKGETMIEIQMRTLRPDAIEKLRALLYTLNRYQMEYGISITSSMFRIENNILGLAGIESVLIQGISVETTEDKESFRVNLNLIGFDQTQRSSEELKQASIFSDDTYVGSSKELYDAFMSYSARKRNDKGFEYGVIDVDLRNAEIYPDLALPTYDEVNAVIPLMKLRYYDGTPFKKLNNPDHARYVDPDFYIRADMTYRDVVRDTLNGGQIPILYSDRIGGTAGDATPSEEQAQEGMLTSNLVLSPGTMSFINEQLAKLPEEKISATTQVNPTQTFINEAATSSVSGYITSKEIQKVYQWNRNYKTDPLSGLTPEMLNQKPTTAEINGWGGGIVPGQNPTAAQIDGFIESLANEYLVNVPTAAEWMSANDLSLYPELRNATATTISYIYGSDGTITGPAITREKVINLYKSIVDVETGGAWCQFTDAGLPYLGLNKNREGKLLSIDIGIGQVNSWSGDYSGLSEARRCAWDWKFALQLSMGHFCMTWNALANKINRYGAFIEVGDEDKWNRYAPQFLDRLAIAYNKLKSIQWIDDGLDASVVTADGYYCKVKKILLGKYGASPLYKRNIGSALPVEGDTLTKNAEDLYIRMVEYLWNWQQTQKLNVLSIASSTIQNARPGAEAIASIVATGNSFMTMLPQSLSGVCYEIKVPQARTFTKSMIAVDPYGEAVSFADYVTQSSGTIKPIEFSSWVSGAVAVLSGTPSSEIRGSTISAEMEKVLNPETHFILIKKGAAQATAEAIFASGKITKESSIRTNPGIKDLAKYISFVEIDVEYQRRAGGRISVTSANLSNTELAQAFQEAYKTAYFLKTFTKGKVGAAYRSAYQDMLDYDGRGRLIRAFPTYHLYIIDEGRAMQWHKMWDNFYGYNAMLSMELIKDRRMVADVCVLRVSNMYHGLSSYDSETSYGKWDRSVVDLIFGGGSEFTKKQRQENRQKVWRTIWDLPDSDQLQARRDEINSMMLKTGARIHLRMGYGANAAALPIAINGTVTEVELGDVVTMIVQGDGVELTNKLRVPVNKTTTSGWLRGTAEPRQFLCQMMTSKGNMWANLINSISDNLFFSKSPLGIVHFGSVVPPTSNITEQIPIVSLFEKKKGQYNDYGEVGQNIYCGSGVETRSQWLYANKRKAIGEVVEWGQETPNFLEMDEPTVKINLFDKTPWDMFQTYSAVCPDYVSAVIPFEFRSSVYFGKPNWDAVTSYKYRYFYDKAQKFVYRAPAEENTRTFSQFRIWDGASDIISNEIMASERYLYNNVIAKYNMTGKPKLTEIYQVDSDITDDKQKTAIVEVPIECDGPLKAGAKWARTKAIKSFSDDDTDGWANQVRYAETAAVSALKDYMREMYQGELIVWGDPSVKPHDTAYMSDDYNQMAGSFWVKRVVHSFSTEGGFRTSVSPDAISIIDDMETASFTLWGTAGAATMLSAIARFAMYTSMMLMLKAPVGHLLSKMGAKAGSVFFREVLSKSAELTPSERVFMMWAGDTVEDRVKAMIKAQKGGTGTFTKWYNQQGIASTEWWTKKLEDDAFKNFSTYAQHKYQVETSASRLKTIELELKDWDTVLKNAPDATGVDKINEMKETIARLNKQSEEIKAAVEASVTYIKGVEDTVEGAEDAYKALGSAKTLLGQPVDAISGIIYKPSDVVKKAIRGVLKLDDAGSTGSKIAKFFDALKTNIMTPGATVSWVEELWDGKKVVETITDASKVVSAAEKAAEAKKKVAEAQKVERAAAGVADITDDIKDAKKMVNLGEKAIKGAKGIWKPVQSIARTVTSKAAGTGAFAIRNTTKLVATVGKSKLLLALTPYVIVEAAISIICANLIDWTSRALDRRQSLIIIPLKYRGKNFTAGMNGSRGAIMGSTPSVVDAFLSGEGFAGGVVTTAYALLGIDPPEYNTSNLTNELTEDAEVD